MYELLQGMYPQLDIHEDPTMPKGLSGLYFDNVIKINKHIFFYEKTGVLAEELGHYETTHGDISDLSCIRNRKLEVVARRWGYRKIVPIKRLVDCFRHGNRTIEDVCLYLEITPAYLKNVLDYYKARHGDYCTYENYTITFDPLNIERSA